MLCNRFRLICAVEHFAFASFAPAAGRAATEARLVLPAEKATSLPQNVCIFSYSTALPGHIPADGDGVYTVVI